MTGHSAMGAVPGPQRLRVCIVTPGQIGSNPRVVKEADTLHAAGYDVLVIATKTLEAVEPRDRALMQRIPWDLQRIDISSRVTWRARRVAQIAARSLYRATGSDSIADRAFSPFTSILANAALKVPADLYIAHYPAALPAAAAAAQRYGAAFAYDAEDFHLGGFPDDAAYKEDKVYVRAIEARYLPSCAYVMASSPGIAEAYANTYGIERPHVALNVFPLDRSPNAPTLRGVAEPGPSIYWFSQTIGPLRGLECAVKAIGLAQSRPHLFLQGASSPIFSNSIQELASRAGSVGRVHFLPPSNPDDLVQRASKYDVGLCSEPGHNENNRLALSNKLFTYCLAGTPPLMSDTPAQKAFADEADLTDLVYSREDPEMLARAIDQTLGMQDKLAALRAQIWSAGRKRWNWDIESSMLLQAVDAVVGQPNLDSCQRQASGQ